MKLKTALPFKILTLDNLGQGVSKITESVTFIPKTLPGEEGMAIEKSKKKGVAFAKVKRLTKVSPLRQEPECQHFQDCPGCHYLHTNYDEEIKFKAESFKNIFRNMSLPPLNIISAPQRLSYRNRVQLHYSLKSKLIGMRDPLTYEIIPAPRCRIALPQIQQEVQRLYDHQQWLTEAPQEQSEGHVEIYLRRGKLLVSWNKPYAHEGFTQVFEDMNIELKKIIKMSWGGEQNYGLLDLFAGDGNLSNELSYSSRLCVDSYKHKNQKNFFNQNLYRKNALERVRAKLEKEKVSPDFILLDPPRSGMKDLHFWLKTLVPKKVAYVSCDPHTMARDINELSGYQITQAHMLDFFPSTYHFESLIFLEKNK